MQFKQLAILTGLATSTFAMAFQNYSITDLGDLPGGADSSYAEYVNDNGVVACTGTTAAGLQAYRWDAVNGITPLPLLPGRTQAVAIEIDSLGNIVGDAFTTDTLVD